MTNRTPAPLRSSFTALAVVLAACGGSSSGGGKAFSTADLEGTWRVSIVASGAPVASGMAPGWTRVKLAIDAAGHGTFLSYADAFGGPTPTNPPVYAVDADGNVTSASFPAYRGKLNPARNRFVSVSTVGTAPNTWTVLRIAERLPAGTTYSLADLAGKSFTYHQLLTGSQPGWERGTISYDAAGVVSLTHRTNDTGTPLLDVPNAGTVAVDAEGFSTVGTDPSIGGILSADRASSVVTRTIARDPANHVYVYAFRVQTQDGGSFAEGDLAGAWNVGQVEAGTASAWGWGALAFDASGAATFQSCSDGTGSTSAPNPFTLTLSPQGIATMTAPAGSTWTGTLSRSKDLLAGVDTFEAGRVGIIVGTR